MPVKSIATVENWEEYCAHNYDYRDPVGFIGGTECTVSEVTQLLSTTSSYDELKTELLAYIKEREEFVRTAREMYKSGSFKELPFFRAPV